MAAFNQLYELVEERRIRALPYQKQELDLARIHRKLIECQEMCRKFGV